jgi:hypothetical protein
MIKFGKCRKIGLSSFLFWTICFVSFRVKPRNEVNSII